MLTAHGMQTREGGDLDHGAEEGAPLKQCALPAHGMQERGGEGGRTPYTKGEGGTPPKQARSSFLQGLIQDMGGNPQDLSSPPTLRDEARGKGQEGRTREDPGSKRAHHPH